LIGECGEYFLNGFDSETVGDIPDASRGFLLKYVNNQQASFAFGREEPTVMPFLHLREALIYSEPVKY